MAAGRPVIAYGHGGALDTVLPGETGVLFNEPTVESLIGAMEECEQQQWDPAACRTQAEHFDVAVFRNRIEQMLARQRSG